MNAGQFSNHAPFPHSSGHSADGGGRSRAPSVTPSRAPKRSTPASSSRIISSRLSMGEVSPSDTNEEEDGFEEEEARAEAKRRKIQRACDLCRRKKIKCDAWDDGKAGQCSNCDEANLRCAYVEAAKRRGPPPGYIETLEWKLRRLEDLAMEISPNLDLLRVVGPSIHREDFNLVSWKRITQRLGLDVERARGSGLSRGRLIVAGGKEIDLQMGRPRLGPSGSSDKSEVLDDASQSELQSGDQQDSMAVTTTRIFRNIFNVDGTLSTGVMSSQEAVNALGGDFRGDGGSGASADRSSRGAIEAAGCDQEELRDQDLSHQFGEVSIDGYRYHGKASGVQLLRTVMDYKYADHGATEPSTSQERYLSTLVNSRRPELWSLPIWEANVANGAVNSIDLTRWPEPDLAQTLIDAYFDTDNNMLPLLNRKIFQSDYDSHRYRVDHSWAKVCLLVFANAARMVDDPRVYWYADDPKRAKSSMENMDVYRQSAGWRWLDMSIKAGRNILAPAALEDLQMHVLVSSFLMRSAVLHVVYAIAGNGLRAAQDLGVHTRVSAGRIRDRAQAELHNRAFWCLIWLDRICCAGMGRTISLQDEDFDVEYPLAVEDEYWNTGDPSKDFIQPIDVPSKLAYFVCILKLLRVVERVLKQVYSVSGGERERDAGPDAQKRMIAELDSDLYSWLDGVPESLRWEAQRADPVLFQQSCHLYSIYYFTQILIHRPFIPTPKSDKSKGPMGGFPSLAICTNAARSCSHVIDAHNQRCPASITMMLPAFTSAVVLLIGVWGGQKAGVMGEASAALADVRKCLQCMKMAEVHYRAAGRMRDIVTELANLSETSLATPSPSAPGPTLLSKRSRMDGSASISSSSRSSPVRIGEPPSERRIHNLPRLGSAVVTAPAISSARTELANDARDLARQSGPIGTFAGPAQWAGLQSVPPNPPYHQQESQYQHVPLYATIGDPAPARTIMVPGSGMMNGAPGPPAFPTPMSPNGIERLLNGQLPPGFDPAGGIGTFGSSEMQISDARGQWAGGTGQSITETSSDNMSYGAGYQMPNQALFDVAGMTWPYGMSETTADATQSGGVMADIWSMAPGTFEMDAWISYLQQAGPGSAEPQYVQSQF